MCSTHIWCMCVFTDISMWTKEAFPCGIIFNDCQREKKASSGAKKVKKLCSAIKKLEGRTFLSFWSHFFTKGTLNFLISISISPTILVKQVLATSFFCSCLAFSCGFFYFLTTRNKRGNFYLGVQQMWPKHYKNINVFLPCSVQCSPLKGNYDCLSMPAKFDGKWKLRIEKYVQLCGMAV